MKKQPVAVLIAKRRIPERSVGIKTNPQKNSVSERRDLYLCKIIGGQKEKKLKNLKNNRIFVFATTVCIII